MSEYTAIADIGESLIQLLRGSMADLIKPDSIVLLSPADMQGEDVRVTLFLYQIQENPYLKNQDWESDGAERRGYPALKLYLYYLMTTYASGHIPDRSDRSLEEHRVMGRAMRILYDNAVLKGSALRGGLTGSAEEFSVALHPMSLDEQNKIWSAFPNRSFRASVAYQVSTVSLDSLCGASTKRVTVRDL